MNVAELVVWGGHIVQSLDEDGSQPPDWDPHRVEQAVGWVRQYRQELEQWRQLVEVGTIVRTVCENLRGHARRGAAVTTRG